MPSSANVLYGNVRLFVGTALTDVLPADTVLLGAAWGGTWVDIGYTSENGITVHFEVAYDPLMSAQDSSPILYLPSGSTDTIAAELLENTLANLKFATGRGTIATVAAGGSPGHDEITFTDPSTPAYYAVGWEWSAPPNTKSNPQRGIFPQVMSTDAVEMNMRRGEAGLIPVTWQRVGASAASAPKIRNVTTL